MGGGSFCCDSVNGYRLADTLSTLESVSLGNRGALNVKVDGSQAHQTDYRARSDATALARRRLSAPRLFAQTQYPFLLRARLCRP